MDAISYNLARSAILRRAEPPYSALVAKDGSTVWAEDSDGKTIASGESEVDDASVINSALIEAYDVVLQRETFIIKEPIKMNDFCRLEGRGISGAGTVLKLADGANCNVIEFGSGTGHKIEIRNLKIDGNKSNNTTGWGIHLSEFDRGLIERIRVESCASGGIYVTGGDDNTIFNVQVAACDNYGIWMDTAASSIIDCKIGGGTYGIYSSQYSNFITGCKIYSSSVGMYLNTFLHGIAIGNRIEPAEGGVGIKITAGKLVDVDQATVAYNRIFGNFDIGIEIYADKNNIANVNLEGNSFWVSSGYTATYGIYSHAESGLSVSNVTWAGCKFIGDISNKVGGDGLEILRIEGDKYITFTDSAGSPQSAIGWGTANDNLNIRNPKSGVEISLRGNGRILLNAPTLILLTGGPTAIAGEIYRDDYGGNFANFTPPTPKSAGHIFFAEDTNATNPAKRLYISIDGSTWSYVDLT